MTCLTSIGKRKYPEHRRISSDILEKSLRNLKKAIKRFSEVLQEPTSSIVIDATIQRFKFTYELMWKTHKIFLEDIHGVRAGSPRLVFIEAYALSIIEEEGIFQEMIKSRNLLSHTYNEEQAAEIYRQCPSYLAAINNIYDQISNG